MLLCAVYHQYSLLCTTDTQSRVFDIDFIFSCWYILHCIYKSIQTLRSLLALFTLAIAAVAYLAFLLNPSQRIRIRACILFYSSKLIYSFLKKCAYNNIPPITISPSRSSHHNRCLNVSSSTEGSKFVSIASPLCPH